MSTTKPRSETPPPPRWSLTPPLTGGFNVKADTVYVENIRAQARHQTQFKEGESPAGFFEEALGNPDIETQNSNSEVSLSENNTPPVSPAPSTSVTSASINHDKYNASLFDTTTGALVVNEPFPFSKLPHSIRTQVYEHLLVIPALICVRQKHTAFHDEKKAFLYAEPREVLLGIAYALAQLTVDGSKVRFAHFKATNINILRVNKEVFAEAKAFLYGKNAFEIVKPSNELSPPPNFSVHLFPSGCQRLVTKLNIRIHCFYDLNWLLDGGYNDIKNFYRGLRSLTLVLELQSATKGFGKQWARKESEKWTLYIGRLRKELVKDLGPKEKGRKARVIPTWVDLRILFSGESYDKNRRGAIDIDEMQAAQSLARDEPRRALMETWELFKKGA